MQHACDTDPTKAEEIFRACRQPGTDQPSRPDGFQGGGRAGADRGGESITRIRKRLVSPGISLGALSPEAHETLSIAMNRIGAKSDSGEGGEDPSRFQLRENGDNPSSAIKQIASGRFGVTAEYLNNCKEIEIKVAQGAKLGEVASCPASRSTA